MSGRVYIYDASRNSPDHVRAVIAQERLARNAEVTPDGGTVYFMLEEDLYSYEVVNCRE